MMQRHTMFQRRRRGGYAMLVALVLIAVLTIIGATSLSVAGVDQRIALHNQRHMIIVNAADAGTDHARSQLEDENPIDEGWDTADTGHFIPRGGTDGADAMFAGTEFPLNQGTYRVEAIYLKCAAPPPGYSTELGRQGFRSDFWNLQSSGMYDIPSTSSASTANPIEATVVSTVRHVVQGPCKIR